MSPGSSVRPSRASSAASPSRRPRTTAPIRPRSITTARSRTGSAPVPSISVAPVRMSRSMVEGELTPFSSVCHRLETRPRGILPWEVREDSGTGPVDSGAGRVYLKVDPSHDSACDARSPRRGTPRRSRARRGARLRGDRGTAVSAAQARARLRAPRPPGQDGAPRRPARQGRARLLLGDLVTGLPGGVAFRQQALSGPQAEGARGPAGQLQGKCGAREAHGGRARLRRTRAPRRVRRGHGEALRGLGTADRLLRRPSGTAARASGGPARLVRTGGPEARRGAARGAPGEAPTPA